MPGKTSMFNDRQNDLIRGEILMRLVEENRPMTIEEISRGNIVLAGLSSQKISRSLCELADRGVVYKMKSKLRNNRMVYMTMEVYNSFGG